MTDTTPPAPGLGGLTKEQIEVFRPHERNERRANQALHTLCDMAAAYLRSRGAGEMQERCLKVCKMFEDDAAEEDEKVAVTYLRTVQAQIRALPPAPASPDDRVSVPAAGLIAIRDALTSNNVDEAYHQLYTLVQWKDPYKPWEEWLPSAPVSEGEKG